MKYAFAGDREISCNVLELLMDRGYPPSALLLTDRADTTHSEHLVRRAAITEDLVFYGSKIINEPDTLAQLAALDLDYIIGIHYPYIIPKALLELPKIGFLNLHPAYLPFNKGWHTPSWAIMDNTLYGATLHFMAEELDAGDIIHQKQLDIQPDDTANTLYQRVLKLEEKVFAEALEDIVSLKPQRLAQTDVGTSHKRADLEQIREFTLDDQVVVGEFLDRLRALTTNRDDEAAFFIEDGRKIGVKINFIDL